ncbi:hypothetical protein D3C75_947480 [compost metagenome]
MIDTLPPHSFTTDASARKAPVEQEAITLCPHPCPMPFNASYSARNATVGPCSASPASARNEVAMPQYSCCT